MVPWANTAVETELPIFLKGRASIHSARLVPKAKRTNLDDDFLWGLIRAIPEAWESLSMIHLNAVAFCCTSASVFDLESIVELQNNLAKISCPAVTAYTSLVQQLNKLGAKSLVLVTPYVRGITKREAEALVSDGFTVTNSISLELIDDFDQVRSDTLVSSALSAYVDEEAVVISCTGLYTAEALDRISAAVGRPCISSNSAIAQSLLDVSQEH
jgi:maleate isomerase